MLFVLKKEQVKSYAALQDHTVVYEWTHWKWSDGDLHARMHATMEKMSVLILHQQTQMYWVTLVYTTTLLIEWIFELQNCMWPPQPPQRQQWFSFIDVGSVGFLCACPSYPVLPCLSKPFLVSLSLSLYSYFRPPGVHSVGLHFPSPSFPCFLFFLPHLLSCQLSSLHLLVPNSAPLPLSRPLPYCRMFHLSWLLLSPQLPFLLLFSNQSRLVCCLLLPDLTQPS